MLKLFKLELRKNKISTYFLASLCILIVCFGICFLFAFVPRIMADSVSLPAVIDMEMFTQWNDFTMLITMVSAMSFAVLSAVMHTKFTVEEYTGKAAILLFSYPQSKGKILLAKCSLVFAFTVVGLVVTNTIAILLFAIISNTFGIMPNAFELSMIPNLLSISLICGLLSASIGMIAMRVGFWKKSLIATIVTAVILISPYGNVISLFPQHSFIIQLIGMVVLFVISLFIFISLFIKVGKMEAI